MARDATLRRVNSLVQRVVMVGLGLVLGAGCAEQPGKKADDDKKDAKDGKSKDGKSKDAKDDKEAKVSPPK